MLHNLFATQKQFLKTISIICFRKNLWNFFKNLRKKKHLRKINSVTVQNATFYAKNKETIKIYFFDLCRKSDEKIDCPGPQQTCLWEGRSQCGILASSRVRRRLRWTSGRDWVWSVTWPRPTSAVATAWKRPRIWVGCFSQHYLPIINHVNRPTKDNAA